MDEPPDSNMSTQHPEPKPQHLSRRILAALFIFTLAIRLPVVFLPPSCDEAIFAAGGNVWLRHDGLIYRDLLDNKPPGIYLVYGLSRVLLDAPFTGPRVAAGFCAAATAVLIALFAATLLSPAAGILAGLAFALLSTAVFTPMAYTEAFMLPFSVGALWLAWRSFDARSRWAALASLAGLCAGIALLFKQVAVAELGAVVAAALTVREHRWRRLAVIIGGVAVPVGGVIAYLASRDILYAAYEGIVLVVGPAIWRGHGVVIWLKEGLKLLLPVFPLAVGTVWALAGPLRRLSLTQRVLLYGWLILSSGAALGALRFAPPQLLQILPPLCVFGGVGLVSIWRAQSARLSRPRLAAAVIVVAGCLIAAGLAQAPRYARVIRGAVGGARHAVYHRIAAHVAAHTSFSDPIYVASNDAHIYVYADRVPASRVFNVFHTDLPGLRAELLSALAQRRPLYIVLDNRRLGGERIKRDDLEPLLVRHYELVPHLSVHGLETYRLKGRSD